MINKEVVVFQIEDMLSNINKENLLSFGGHIDNGAAFLELMTNVLTLLKEKEPVEPAMDEDSPGHWIVLENCSNAGVYCSECHTKIFDHYPMKKKFSYFCPHCGTRMEGQAVKWDD